MIEFELAEQTYRAGKLDAMRQFHVSRRIAPIIPTLVPVFVELARNGMRDINIIAQMLEPFAEGLAGMSDEASEYVLGTCLSVVQRKSGTNWAPVWNAQGKVAMFDDIDLSVLMQLAMRVIQDSLGPFIQGLLISQQSSPQFSPTQTG